MARILVVEDDPANLKLMIYLLRTFSHATLEAMDGESALAVAQCERPDLILCDVDLPKMDGLQVARALKQDPALRSISLVAVTALAMVGDRERILQAGFDGYLLKPIQPRQFVPQLEQFLPETQRGQADPRPEVSTTEASPPLGPRLGRVLVVDDIPTNLQLVRWTLQPNGYTTILASSTEEALEEARKEPPDLVLSDIAMPGNDGFELLAAWRADPLLHDIPFVFLSSTYVNDEDLRRARTLGGAAFLQRPLTPKELLAEVERLIGKGRGDRVPI